MPRLLDVLMALAFLLGSTVAVPGVEADSTPQGVWPLDPQPRVHARFDPPDRRWLPGHRGVDLVGVPGAWVGSALPGRVSFAGPVAGKQVVVVDHGRTRTTYEPVLADVQVGQRVAAGERIGWLLAAPSHCAPAACLHWGWREGPVYLDPLLLVGSPTPVRLLPWWSALPGSDSPLDPAMPIRPPGSRPRVSLSIGVA